MISINLLPNEILFRIFQYLQRDNALFSISLTCKHFYAVVEPVIFSHISTENSFALNKIFKVMVRKPYAARFVKEFHASTNADYDDIESADETFSVYISDMTELEHYKAKIGARMPLNTHGRRICARWYERLFRGERNWDAVIAWLIRDFGSTLTILRMNLLGLQKFCHIERVLLRAASLQRMNVKVNRNHLSKLREVHIQKDDSAVKQDTGIEIRFALPYLALPSVKTACITGLCQDATTSTPVPKQQTFATEKLHLRESYLTTESVQEFLAAFNNLRSFNYRYAAPKSRNSDRFLSTAVVFGLQNSEHCLEELVLTKSRKGPYFDDHDFDGILGWIAEGDWDVFPLEVDALEGFTRLKHLEIGIDILLEDEDEHACSYDWENDSEAEEEFTTSNNIEAGTSADREPSLEVCLTYSPERRQTFSAIIPSTIEVLTLHEVRPSFTALLPILWSKSFRQARPNFLTLRVSCCGVSLPVVKEWRRMAEKRGLGFQEVKKILSRYEC